MSVQRQQVGHRPAYQRVVVDDQHGRAALRPDRALPFEGRRRPSGRGNG